jgi:hypothetical protein
MRDGLKTGAVFSYLASAVCISLGFYKMFVYENSTLSFIEPKNVYVGGDAYNFIINANYATAYFTLATFCAVIGMTFMISYLLTKEQPKNINTKEEIVEQEV